MAKFDPGKILEVLTTFVGRGSVLGDIAWPYHVTYAEAVSATGHTVAYGPQYFWAGLPYDAKAIIILMVVAVSSFILLSNERLVLFGRIEEPRRVGNTPYLPSANPGRHGPVRPVHGPGAHGACGDVAAQYQDWHFKQGVTAYSHTIFSQFGLSVALSAAILASFAALRRAPPQPWSASPPQPPPS